MAYNPYIKQVGGTSLQGGTGSYLQGSVPTLQGSTPTLQGSTPTPTPTSYGSPGVTSPAKQAYVNDLSSRYGLNNGTVYDKTNNTGFTNQQDFFNASGVNSFNGLKFDTAYQPVGSASSAPISPQRNATNDLAMRNALIPTEAERDPMSQLKNVYSKYIESLAPSKGADRARREYADFIQSRDLGVQKINDKVIPMEFITGQKQSLLANAEIQGNRLQNQIGIEDATQASRANSLKAKADFESNLYSMQQQGAEASKKFAYENGITTPFYNIGGTIYRTSDGKAFSSQGEAFGAGVARDYSNAPEIRPQQSALTLSEGEAVYDPITGEMVFKNPKTYDPSTGGREFGNLGLTAGQSNLFSSIVSKYNNSPLVQAADRVAILADSINKVKSDPNNGTLQLNLAYSYIQALDTYQSAVREGELSLVNSIDSRVGQLQGEIQKMTNGQIVRGDVAIQIANAAENIVNVIKQAAQQKAQSFQSQASVVGLGDAWQQYIGGFQQGYGGGGGGTPDDIINKYLQGFNSVGNTTASRPYLSTLGAVTGIDGSPLWKYGLDVDLKVGDPVRTPISGIVVAARPNGGFGNQVKIKTVDGNEIWLSHLDRGTVKVGQAVRQGQLIGYGGKTGNVIPMGGGDGSHLDITIKGKDGRLWSAREVKKLLDTKKV